MARNLRTLFLFVFASLILFVLLYQSHAPSSALVYHPPATTSSTTTNFGASFMVVSNVITESIEVSWVFSPRLASQLSPSLTFPIPSVAVLLPDWEVLVLVSPDFSPLAWDVNDPYVCLFDKGITSPAFPAGVLPFPDRIDWTPPILLRWNFVVYDSLATEDDVVLFVKGVNNRQGINREPTEFQCTFFAGDDAVKTVVTSSMQEVFRCKRPDLTAFPLGEEKRIKVSLEILGPNNPVLVPTVAYYTAPRNLSPKNGKSLLCVATMVRNVAKFLNEWILYHSKIGVDKFILYDNGSDDDLQNIVESLVRQGFDISTYFWLWPKTQEAGFSHSAVYANTSCRWIMYVDVDEFVYSPAWAKVSKPSKALLHSLLPKLRNHSTTPAQVNIGCMEFGPSGQTVHPETGVTQGYNCRKEGRNRHKSIVLLEAIDHSLMNVIHHFILKPGYMSKKLSLNTLVVNHYKFQAWPEFKAKFRRRVSAYVFDWTQPLNPKSNDRTPGLGYTPVEPADWPTKFCEVYDDGLKNLTRRWFGVESPQDYKMAWHGKDDG
nr:glycosyltransferase family 92 protein RCOM_0530710-like [Ipomoea batatas]